MKLYHKNLTSLKALRKEKATLKSEANSSLQNILEPEILGKNGSGNINPIHTALDFLTSKDFTSKLMALSVPVLKIAGKKIERNTLKKLVKEVFSGYFKWKAFEVGFNIVKNRFSKAA